MRPGYADDAHAQAGAAPHALAESTGRPQAAGFVFGAPDSNGMMHMTAIGERQLRTTRRMDVLDTESAFEVAARARELEAGGRRIAHLSIGEPAFPTPPHIVSAGVEALRNGATRFTPPAGLPELRGAIAAALAEREVRV